MAKAKEMRNFGIGEWYGKLAYVLDPATVLRFAEESLKKRKGTAEDESSEEDSSTQDSTKSAFPCPFRIGQESAPCCNKRGGVCSLRVYVINPKTGKVSIDKTGSGRLRTTCPSRFEEDELIYNWVGETILGVSDPLIVSEIGFLESVLSTKKDDVGRIDGVLVSRKSEERLEWCAIEKQAVYFQGKNMAQVFRAIQSSGGNSLVFPPGRRQPDYRSSGPKRLMPQLQIKVPSLRRWGKKMAVVIDEDFFDALGPMERVNDISSCDIAWFVVGYEEAGERARLCKREVCMTTLERAVEGLTAGLPVSLREFETRIRKKLKKIGK